MRALQNPVVPPTDEGAAAVGSESPRDPATLLSSLVENLASALQREEDLVRRRQERLAKIKTVRIKNLSRVFFPPSV